MMKTYGRKAAKRESRKNSMSRETTVSEDPLTLHEGEFETPTPSPTRKRQKVEVEVIHPAPEHTLSPAKRRKLESDAVPGRYGQGKESCDTTNAKKRPRDSGAGISRGPDIQNNHVLPTAGPSMQRSTTFPSYTPGSNSASPPTPNKSVNHLSKMFDLSSPIEQSPKVRPPGSITKGMLGRSQTDSSIDNSKCSRSDSPSTPKKTIKDLSNLFSLTSPSGNSSGAGSPGRSRTGIAKRMLGRSYTDSSVGTNAARPDDTLPTIPTRNRSLASPDTLRRTVSHDLSREQSSLHAPSPPSKAPTSVHTRTYAGKSRSFLVALPASHTSALMNGEAQEEEDAEMRESYADLRNRWGVDNSEDDPPDPSSSHTRARVGGSQSLGMMNDLKSISELRSKGESRRFLDEVGYLFEGLQGTAGTGLRRASALEVVTKLCDPEFSRKAKAADFYGKTWDVLREAMAGSGDKVLDAILLFFVALAARDPHSLAELAQKPDGISVLMDALDSATPAKDILSSAVTFSLGKASVADIKSLGLMKTDIAALKALAEIILKKSRLFPPDVEISSRFLVSHALARLPATSLEKQHIASVLQSLRKDLRLFPPRVDAYIAGLPFLPSSRSQYTDIPSLDHVECCLRLVDSFLLGKCFQPGKYQEAELVGVLTIGDQEAFANELVTLCLATETLMRDEQRQARQDIARKCLCIALRILTTLSRENVSWCRGFLSGESLLPLVISIVTRSQEKWATSQMSDDESEDLVSSESVQAFDLLCLALGLVLNWASTFQQVKNLIRVLYLDPACTGSRHCIKTCQCSDKRSILQCLVLVYLQQNESHIVERPETKFLQGYLSVLFGLLMQDCSANQSAILSSLPGRSSRENIKTFIDNTREFVKLYGSLSGQLSAIPVDEIQEDDAMDGHDHDADSVLQNGNGEDIARGMITFFETMRSKA